MIGRAIHPSGVDLFFIDKQGGVDIWTIDLVILGLVTGNVWVAYMMNEFLDDLLRWM